ncbi:MAG: MinD/ParA family protein [Candidatus Marinimicrobia bacterium]|nr:MinD/ParA family protein [Candidatus Neomarinimicrobiota bacterium]MCF7841141.1 MinD/ParA family protein [Candidatus Neomarinimicrobiota bacterium]MCF7902401.1 MinD/ParA family protein [Candidatus Neomarinimicrobiota bacterium]
MSINSSTGTRAVDRIRPEVWAVTSGKGGVGKTNLSVNMASVLARMGYRVLLIDADIHLGNVDLLMGIRTKFTIADVLEGTKTLKEIIFRAPGDFDILPAASAVVDLLETKQNVFRDIISSYSRFQQNYDIVLVDTAAGISTQVLSFVFSADKSIVVATPDPASLTDAYGMIKLITRNRSDAAVMLVLNMVANENEGQTIYHKMNLMTQRFLSHSLIYIGSILQDSRIAWAVRNQQPLLQTDPNSPPAKAIRFITRKIMEASNGSQSRRTNLFEGVYKYRDFQIGGGEV